MVERKLDEKKVAEFLSDEAKRKELKEMFESMGISSKEDMDRWIKENSRCLGCGQSFDKMTRGEVELHWKNCPQYKALLLDALRRK